MKKYDEKYMKKNFNIFENIIFNNIIFFVKINSRFEIGYSLNRM